MSVPSPATNTPIDPMVLALRQFAVGFMTGHDPSVCAQIMDPGYTLIIGRHVLAGRDKFYLPAVVKQLEMFPGLTFTVHSVIAAPGHCAFHFSEHGASGGPGGPFARWGGIAMFRWNGHVFTSCVANEDYASRRRQVKSGMCESVPLADVAPWDTQLGSANPAAEAVVREALEQPGWLVNPRIRFDDGPVHNDDAELLRSTEVEVLDLFSSGNDVAFGAVHTVVNSGTPAEVFITGIVRVEVGEIKSGIAVRDRTAIQAR